MQRSCVVHECSRPVTNLVLCLPHKKRLDRNGHVRDMTAEDRFFKHVTEVEDGCWLYSPIDPETGYGRFADDKRKYMAHRWSYEHFRAEIPEGLEIDHLCSNTACVNPWHLEPVTSQVNSERGVGSRATCINNHPYDASNTEVHARGHRQCRTCRLARERRSAAAA